MVKEAQEFDLDAFEQRVLLGIDALELETSALPRSLVNEIWSAPRWEVRPPTAEEWAEERRQKTLSDIRHELSQPFWKFSKRRLHDLFAILLVADDRAETERRESVNAKLERLEHELTSLREAEERARAEAIRLLLHQGVRTRLCAVLKTISDDAHDVAKVITPIIVPLVLTGVIKVPLEPFVFSHLAVLIARMGIAAICSESKKAD